MPEKQKEKQWMYYDDVEHDGEAPEGYYDIHIECSNCGADVLLYVKMGITILAVIMGDHGKVACTYCGVVGMLHRKRNQDYE